MSYIYGCFAEVYDKLTKDIDYKKWADYIELLFATHGISPKLVVDLGCGTGSFCEKMINKGYEMIGIDSSAEMLSQARQKINDDILLLNQDMCDFELYGTVDAFVSLLDSVNYLTDKRKLRNMFKLVKNYLNPGGLFIFDINTVFKFENVYSNNTFYFVDDDICYIWQNTYDRKKRICEFDLTFFIKSGELYKRFDEVHYEKAYEIDEIVEVCKHENLILEGVYHEFALKKPRKNSQRVFFVFSKK